jgi:hypothetical protein
MELPHQGSSGNHSQSIGSNEKFRNEHRERERTGRNLFLGATSLPVMNGVVERKRPRSCSPRPPSLTTRWLPKVGNLTIDLICNYFVITNVASTVEELTLRILNNGQQIELKRCLLGRSTDIKVWRLPYQVHQCEAHFHPIEFNGSLTVKINKFKQKSSKKTGRIEICRQTIQGDPKSLTTSLSYLSVMKSDHYVFIPGKVPKRDTDVTIYLHNNTLEFEFIQSGDTVTKIQTVTFPVRLSEHHLEVKDLNDSKAIIVYPFKTENELVIPDYTIDIR